MTVLSVIKKQFYQNNVFICKTLRIRNGEKTIKTINIKRLHFEMKINNFFNQSADFNIECL